MNLYEVNYEILSKYNPILAQHLSTWLDDRSIEIEILNSKMGLPTAKVGYGSKRPVLLHSLYDPEEETRRIVGKIGLEEKNLIIILGFGLGYYGLEVLRRNFLGYLVIIEKHLSLFKKAMELLDLRPLFSSKRVILLVGMDKEGIKEGLLPIIERLLEIRLQVFIHPLAARSDSDYYRDIIRMVDLKKDYKKPYPLSETTRYYRDLPAKIATYSPSFQQKILKEFLQKLALSPHARVLDLGSGGGFNIPTLLSQFFKVVALDISREALMNSRRDYGRGRVHYEVCDIHSIPFDEKFFDLVVCTEVLQFIPDIEVVILEIYRVLKDGGYLVVSTSNYNNLIGLLKKRRDRILKAERWNPWGTNLWGGFDRHTTPWKMEKFLRPRFKIIQTRGADYILAWLFWTDLKKYQLRYPGLFLGRLPGFKSIGMHYYILARKG